MTSPRTPLSALESGIPFESRHIGPDAGAQAKMLAQVGYGSLDELTGAAVPEVIRSTERLKLPDARGARPTCWPSCTPSRGATRSCTP